MYLDRQPPGDVSINSVAPDKTPVCSGCLSKYLGKMTSGICCKILYSKSSEKMAYAKSVDPDQTAPEGEVLTGSTLFAMSFSILRKNCIKKKIKQKRYGIKCLKF